MRNKRRVGKKHRARRLGCRDGSPYWCGLRDHSRGWGIGLQGHLWGERQHFGEWHSKGGMGGRLLRLRAEGGLRYALREATVSLGCLCGERQRSLGSNVFGQL